MSDKEIQARKNIDLPSLPVKKGRVFTGEVVSDKMDKTIVVEVTRLLKHPMYGKVIKKRKNFKVHDSDSIANVGDIVEFRECRPISKSKHSVLVRVLPK